jgi:hypothetical protein
MFKSNLLLIVYLKIFFKNHIKIKKYFKVNITNKNKLKISFFHGFKEKKITKHNKHSLA